MNTPPSLLRALGLSALIAIVACASDPNDGSPQGGDEEDVVTARSIVGTWELDAKTNTDSVVTWWNSLELRADRTFVGDEGGNACDDEGNCQAGTTAGLAGTYSLGSAGGKRTIMFHFEDKQLATDRFVFSLSGTTMKMQLAADKESGADFAMKRK